jgi:hypothetical protein
LVVAQGTIHFSDIASGVVFSHIYTPQISTRDSNLSGNVATAHGPSAPHGDYPTGTTSYVGPLLGGSATGPTNELDFTNGFLWTAQLWAAAGSNVPVANLQPIAQYTTTLRTGPTTASAGFITPLSFTAANPDPGIPGAAQAGSATCQLCVWYNGGGTITSFNSAQTAGVPWGASAAFTVSGLFSSNGLPPPLPANLAGLQSFSLFTLSEWTVLPQFLQQPAPVAASQGDNVTFSPVVYGAMTYQWQWNGTNLTDGGRVAGSQSGSLSIATARMGDTGNYQLIVSNLSGASVSTAAALTVAAQPATLQSAAVDQSGDACDIFWNAPPGQFCQIQYTTDVTQTNWINFGGPVAVTNGTVSITDGLTNTQCFYRVIVLP